MIGLQRIGKNLVRVVDDTNILRVKLNSGSTALFQLNEKAQKLDCVLINKGKAVYNHSVQNTPKHDFDVFVMNMADEIATHTKMDIYDIIYGLFDKAIKK